MKRYILNPSFAARLFAILALAGPPAVNAAPSGVDLPAAEAGKAAVPVSRPDKLDDDTSPLRPEKIVTAIEGYDPVAYHFEEKAVKGKKEHTMVWKRERWYFKNETNLKRFQEEPLRFAPQFGGHCGCALAEGELVKGDPQVFRLEDGRLYLFHNKDMRVLWDANLPEYRHRAEKNHVNLLSLEF